MLVGIGIGPGIWPRGRDAGVVLAWILLALAPLFLVLSKMLPGRVRGLPGASGEAVAFTRTILAVALNGSVALYAALAWTVGGSIIAIIALAISLVGMLLTLPSEGRWDRNVDGVARGGEEPAGGAVAPAPPPPVSRRVLAAVLLLSLLGAAALVLGGHVFWTTEVLREPGSPLARLLLSSILASMMAAFAVMRLKRAVASRRPRLQRAYGVLLLVFAGYLLVLAILTA
jgi:hypothetical protein